ncbi:MAG: Do family serine endopeptidase [Parvibaculum sp.]|nr:Do family serine endopeptidase [Parvibaculum sp.]
MSFAAALIVMISAAVTLPAFARAPSPELADLAVRLSPAVVNISTTYMESAGEAQPASPFDLPGDVPDEPDPQEKAQSLGSGFVIDPKGVIVTNNHVIDKADKIDVVFTDGTVLTAKVLGRDEKTDIAVLKVEPKAPLAHVALGDSNHLRVGDWVVAIGNPFGLGGTVTVGIVSALNRDIHAGNYDDFIQTDAAINRGNSGGPLFNLDGEVVGMNTAIISPSGESVGIGFATPASTLKSIVGQILKDGTIRRGWIGVRIQSVTPDLAASMGLKDLHGALIAGVTEKGPASEAGMETGDLVTGFDGRPVREMRDLPRIVAETTIGRSVSVDVIRKGRPRQLTVKVGLLDESEKVVAEKPQPLQVLTIKTLGLDLLALDEEMRERFQLDEEATGALVSDVAPRSAAADKGVKPGDLIVRVGQYEVASPQDVSDRVNAERKAGATSVLLRVITGGVARFVALPLE